MSYDLFTQPKEPKGGTQAEHILTWLRSGRGLTPLEALEQFGCMRLAAVVFDLKALGWHINTRMVERNNKRFARYTMGPPRSKGYNESLA